MNTRECANIIIEICEKRKDETGMTAVRAELSNLDIEITTEQLHEIRKILDLHGLATQIKAKGEEVWAVMPPPPRRHSK
jgi:hypothetical protein